MKRIRQQFSTAEIIGHLDKLTPKGGSFAACGSDVAGMILAGGVDAVHIVM
jgi:hypothetical protein